MTEYIHRRWPAKFFNCVVALITIIFSYGVTDANAATDLTFEQSMAHPGATLSTLKQRKTAKRRQRILPASFL